MKKYVLKCGVKEQDLLNEGFEKRWDGYDLCSDYGYLNYLHLDKSTLVLSQISSTPDFMGNTRDTNPTHIFDALYGPKTVFGGAYKVLELFEVANIE